MSRINTNVSSLIALHRLGRNNESLQTALTRLSTGLRINSGKDDPAGLIASENLRRDITAIEKAMSNSERAGQMIATADSALGQVSQLLNDIRGLVSEAANTGALSEDQIAANQLQVDSSLQAIDRISQTTTFQGRRLLDGNLSFLTSAGSGFSTVADLRIDQANLGAVGSIDVNVEISAAATQAQVTNSIPDTASGQFTLGSQTFTINTKPSAGLDSVSVSLDVKSGPEATGSVTIDGHDFAITAATGEVGIDAVTVTTQTQDLGARGTVTIDQTDFAIELDTGTGVDGSAVVIAKGDLGLAQNRAGTVSLGVGPATFDFDVEVDGSIANLSTKNNISIVIDNTAGADSANFDTGTNELTIYLDAAAGARTSAYMKNLIENADVDLTDVGKTLTVSNQVGELFDGTDDTVTNGTLTVEEAQAAFNAGSNELTITLNNNAEATVTSSFIDTVVTALPEISSVDPTGPTNIDVSAVAVGSIGTLDRPGVLASYADGAPDELTLTFDSDQAAIDINEVITAIEGLVEFGEVTSTSASGTINGTSLVGGSTAAALNRIDGAAANFSTSTNTLTLLLDASDTAITASEVKSAIDGLTTYFENTTSNGTGTIDGTTLSDTTLATAAQVQDLVVRISGATGSEVFSFQSGTSFGEIASAIQLVSDAIGVTAEVVSNQLQLTSTLYGSNVFVDVEVISEGEGGTFETNLSAQRATGTDVVAQINGVQADGDGNTLSINNTTLDMMMTVDDGSSTNVAFTINGGGAVFQLGPDVVSIQQARIGIESVNTGQLGGVSGKLYQLRSGGNKTLARDSTGAAKIVDEAINEVTSLRGRLGAFQRTTLESNILSLQDTLQNLTHAESSIRDADFAKETASLTRAQILVQSGTSVLAIANQNPQNVLALLG